jgi:peptidyl-prolyl cis-trans isomerase C
MTTIKKTSFLLAALTTAVMLSSPGYAAEIKATPMATVNGVVIPSSLLEKNVSINVAQGQKDTPELRAALKEEIISRELVAQEAQKKGLDKAEDAKEQFSQIRQNYLIELAIMDYLKKNPITEAELKTEYDRQIASLGEPTKVQEYQLSQIVTKSKIDAAAALVRIQKGEAFDKVAKDVSINPSKENGGNLGWVLPGQILPSIGTLIVNMKKGAVTDLPIETSYGWNVIKVEDIRKYTPPTFDQSKQQLEMAVLQVKKTAFLKKLRESAKVN